MKDLYSKVGVSVALNSALTTATTDTAGAAIDRQGFNSLMFVAQSGVVTSTAAAFALRVQESDTSTASDFSDAASTDLLGSNPSFAAPAGNLTKKVGYKGVKRYVRIVRTGAATATGIVGALALQGHPSDAPVA